MSNYLKKKLIASTAPILVKSQIHRLFEPFYSGLGHILMLHRVIPSDNRLRIHNHQSLEITPQQLEETILFYKKNGYQFYSLDEVYERLTKGNSSEKFVAFTFDDGYLDNFTIAYPILKKHEVPFTIYVTTNFPDKKAILWWYILEDMLREQAEVNFEWGGQAYHFNGKTILQKEKVFNQIRSFINQHNSAVSFESLLKTIFEPFQTQFYNYADKLTMDWDHIFTLSRDQLCTIGAHTVNHLALKQLDQDAMIYEIKRSKGLIEACIGKEVRHFAYPFGKASEASYREFEAVKSLGFKTATTTRMGNIFSQHRDHLECLPRISLNKATNGAVLTLQRSGFLPFLFHHGKKVITH